ncbi:MAG: 5-(carboxyamino)imidazole ribonucleotide mutase [Spirochaetia bacterium]
MIGIIMGSDSDLPVMRAAAEVCEEFSLDYELTVVSAHRTPKRLVEYSERAAERGVSAIIAGAGGAAHLPGMVASLTPLPVIGVPVKTKALSGVDSLLSIVQMPKGVPVATVAINNARNAGLLAVRICALNDPALSRRLAEFMERQRVSVEETASELERSGWRAFLEEAAGGGAGT